MHESFVNNAVKIKPLQMVSNVALNKNETIYNGNYAPLTNG